MSYQSVTLAASRAADESAEYNLRALTRQSESVNIFSDGRRNMFQNMLTAPT
jgi:hypothetical protein